jgi:transposase
MPANDVVLNKEQRIELSSIAQSRSLPAGYVFRARLILMLAEGAPYSTIKQQLRTTAPTISRWKVRFLRSGIDGLDTRHPGQSATVVTPALRARILSGHAEKAQGRLDTLELPQTGGSPWC